MHMHTLPQNQGAVNFGPNQYFTDTYGPYGPNVEYAPPAYGPPPGYYSGALYGYGGPFNSPAQYQSPAPAYGPPDYGQPAPYGYGQAPYNYAPAPPPPGYGPPSPSTYGQPAPVGYAGYAPEVPSPGRTSNRSGQHNVRFAGTDRGYVAPRRASLMGGQPMPPSMPMSYGVVVPAPAYGLPPRQHLTESPPKAYYDPQQLALPLPPNAPAAMRGYDDDGSQVTGCSGVKGLPGLKGLFPGRSGAERVVQPDGAGSTFDEREGVGLSHPPVR